MKRGTPEHPKTRRLARALNVEPWGAVGVLESLWHWTARYAPAGDVGRFEDADLADGIGWRGDPGVLVAALVACDWIDASEEHRLVVHDWHEHAEDAVQMALARAGKLFANGHMPKIGRLPKEERERTAALFERTESARKAHGESSASASASASALPKPLIEAAPPGGAPAASAAATPKAGRKARRTPAPDAIDPAALDRLRAWCQAKHPALVPRLADLVDACLTFHRGKGNVAADWYATCQTWVRNEAEQRFGRAGPAPPQRPEPGGSAYRPFVPERRDALPVVSVLSDLRKAVRP